MSNDATLDTFFKVLNDTTFANYHDVGYLLKNVFCADNPAVNPQYPCCGITDHGPQFIGAANISILFNELFTSFSSFASTPPVGAAAPLFARRRHDRHSDDPHGHPSRAMVR